MLSHHPCSLRGWTAVAYATATSVREGAEYLNFRNAVGTSHPARKPAVSSCLVSPLASCLMIRRHILIPRGALLEWFSPQTQWAAQGSPDQATQRGAWPNSTTTSTKPGDEQATLGADAPRASRELTSS